MIKHGGSVRRASSMREDLREQLCALILYRRNNKRTIEVIVLLLAACFRDQQTTVAGCTMKEPALMGVRRIMLGTDRIVGTEHPEFECTLHHLMNLPA